ncbi:amino acid adenylation domain-containing protein [Micromonospora peucetia]|uniref:amino acid adenylation domain-containing protein n=1 Tax=Micromonospora peucetia TaxID=47871 RepID=UPI002252A13A|nr:non-ribosomal peptide synthetase [Micromonospora peucetia]MCX4388038.1 amino acid adenylation domain-containing protein [Micromonospora peucetia]
MTASHTPSAPLRQELLDRRLRGAGRSRRADTVTPAPRTGPLPLSFGQHRLWVLDQLQPGGTGYLMSVGLRLRGPLHSDALCRALTELVARHEILRTRYVVVDGEPAQVVDPPTPVEVAVTDLGHTAQETARQRLTELLGTPDPVDLTTGPALRARLVRLAEDEHALVLTMHHISSDGWSEGIILRELAALYGAFVADRPSPLAPLPIQYADFALWQRTRLAGDRLDRQVDHWRDRLTGLMPLELPTDRPRPPVWHPDGGLVTFTVSAAVAGRLRELGRASNATPFMVLLAAFQILLARYTGQTDLAVGTPAAGRDRLEVHGLVGLFLNTLVLRTDLSGEPTFVEVLARVREAVLDAQSHQDVPFERIVDALSPERDLSRNPLFQTMFLFQEGGSTGFDAGGLVGEELSAGPATAKFDLTLGLVEEADGSLSGGVDFPTALFDTATVRRLAGHYQRLLTAVATDPDTPVTRLPMLTDTETAQLTAWNDTAVDHPHHTLTELLDAQAARTPDAVALRFGGEELSYRRLHAEAGVLARRLRQAGVGPESVVAVCLPRGLDLVRALVAILKAGAAYLPLDPDLPARRRAFMVRDSGTHLVITEDFMSAEEHASPTGDPPPSEPITPGHAAYLIYTSGSTGRPKGALVEHRAIVNRLLWMQDAYRLDASDRVLQKTPVGFDVSVWELFWPLVTGATLALARPGGHRDPAYLADLIRTEGITTIHFVPSMLRAFLAEPVGALPSLRRLICSGEALPPELVTRMHERIGCELHNLYGPTETAVDVTAVRCDPGEPVTIGRPIANTTAHIVDADLQPAPVGVPGELLIGGVQLARGYLGRAALTAERFVPDPFAAAPGRRLYRTGDLARYRPCGSIEYLGRIDHQVKIRGQRVEFGEVEAVLHEAPGVTAAAVAVHDEQLVGYLVGPETVDGVRAYLLDRLPDAMVPARWTILPTLPLTASGKVDRRALPAPDPVPGGVTDGYVAPRDELEERIADAFGVALGIDTVGVTDSFFLLGGDSMRAIRMVGLLRAAGLAVSVQDLFTHQSVADLAGVVVRTGPDGETEPTVGRFALVSDADRSRLPDGLVDAYPITQNQAGMLFEMLSGGDRPVYRNVSCYRISDRLPFSLDALREAGRLLTDRQEILRTSFDLSGYSELMQLVHASADLSIGYDDLRGLLPDNQEEVVRGHLRAERLRPFDVTTAPLLRYHVHQLSDSEWRLTHSESHAILDGWSHTSTVAMLISSYRTLRRGERPALPPPPAVRFADFVARERESLVSVTDRGFWAATIAGSDRLELPPEWGIESDAPATVIEVPWADLRPALRRLSAAAGTSLKSVLHAAHLKVMSIVTGRQRFFSGLLCNGRPERLRGDEVFGMYLNTVPFAADTSAPTWRALVQAVFAGEARLWPHRRYPLPSMQRQWGNGTPLLRVGFSYLDFHVLDGPAESVEMVDDFSPSSVGLDVWTFPGVLRLGARPADIDRQYLELLARTYRHVLEAMAADPDGDPDVGLSAADRAWAVEAYQPVERFAAAPFVHDLVAQRATAAPAAVAVRHGDATLTYGELDDRSDRLAARLGELGVRADTIVGIHLPRGIDLIVAMLAVLKAGGAYLPLDPAYPAERVGDMIRDAAPVVVLTDGDLAPRLPCTTATVLVADLANGRPRVAYPPAVRLSGDNLAYVIYTSGSTGRPKGVAVTHRSVLNFCHAQRRILDAHAGDEVLQFASPSFDASVWEILLALANGAALVLPPPDADPGDLRRHAAELTHMTLPPPLLDRLDPADFPRLRVLTTGGEACTADQAARWADRVRVLHAYGPTETTVVATIAELRATDTAPPPIGLPLDNVRAYVVDDELRLLPPGVRGELVLGGAGVVRGYLNRPELTAERFVPDPYASRPGERMYRTGDVVSRDPDGTLHFHGRRDHQVKVRGFRIELGEIENALAAHPAVAAAVVAVHRAGSPDASLVAYTRPANGTVASASALRDHLRERLPQHLVPHHYLCVDDFPYTRNGKVDRTALPAPDGSRPVTDVEYVAPRSDIEEHIATAWSEALGIERIGVHDDFFALGGHSLAMMRLTATLRSRHGYQLTFGSFVEHRTVAGLAATLEDPAAAPAGAMMWLRRGGDGRPPLFCVHPGGGSAHWYLRLAPHLHPDQPVAAFEWPGPHPAGTPTTAQMAERYDDELRRAQPHGPYRLFSWCGGSGIASEMAHRLVEDGHEVTLILLDPGLDIHTRADAWNELGLIRRLELLLHEVDTGGDEADTPERRREILDLLEHLVDDVDEEAGIALPEHGVGDSWPRTVRIWREVMEVDVEYRHRPWPGRLELIVSDELADGQHEVTSGQSYPDYLARWEELCAGGVRVHRVPGDHFSVIKPPLVTTLARVVTDVLDAN